LLSLGWLQWAQLNVHKVADDYEAPEDVEAIRYAIENMGDYKLKTGEDYLLYKTATIAERRQKVLELKIRVKLSRTNIMDSCITKRTKFGLFCYIDL